MTFHSIIEYFKHTWKAKGRHGIHSPFVYDYIEQVLMDREIIPGEYIVNCPEIPLRFENILSRTTAHYKFQSVLFLPQKPGDVMHEKADVLLLRMQYPKQWMHLFDEYFPQLNQNGATAVLGIHNSADHSMAWKKLSTDARVKMSIDLFGIGLLWFRDEFKEQQHFVLKY